MVLIPTLPSLVAVPQPMASYPVRNVAGIDGIDLPGGLFVMGGPGFDNAPAHWVRVSRLWMARTPATNGLVGPILGREVQKGTEGLPIVEVSALEVDRVIAKYNEQHGTQLGSPTEAEWEYAARGKIVHLRDRMEAEGIREGDFVDWAKGRVENLFAHCLGSTIYADPKEEAFQAVLHSSARIYGYCVFGHPEGLDGGKVWYNKGGITSVTGEAAEKRASSFNLIDMIGNVWEWVADRFSREDQRYGAQAYHTLSPIDPVNQNGEYRVYRGGSGFNRNSDSLRAAYRYVNHPDGRDLNFGFRVALAGPQDSSS